MRAELVNAILNVRTELKRDNIIKHVMIMMRFQKQWPCEVLLALVWYAMKTILLKVVLIISIILWLFCRIRFQFVYFHHYTLFFVCLFLLQFGLFWSFSQAHLVYFRKTEVATLTSSYGSKRFSACAHGSQWGFFQPDLFFSRSGCLGINMKNRLKSVFLQVINSSATSVCSILSW